MTKFTVLGTTDEITTCDCCGKTDLKATYAIRMNETGEILHYGSVCVTKNTGIKNPASAAKSYRTELIAAARVKFIQSDEYRAENARFALRTAMKIQPGRESMEFVKEVCKASSEKRAQIAAEFGLEPFEIPSY